MKRMPKAPHFAFFLQPLFLGEGAGLGALLLTSPPFWEGETLSLCLAAKFESLNDMATSGRAAGAGSAQQASSAVAG
jgi:hypothetical protein